jgi:type VI protein secretion system component VasK
MDLAGLVVSLFGIAWLAFALWLAVRLFNRREVWARRTALVMLVATALYILVFLAIFMDEIVWHSNWFSRNLPGWFGPVIRTLYPFSRIFGD